MFGSSVASSVRATACPAVPILDMIHADTPHRGVAAPARVGEPVRYLHKVTLRLVVWLDLAVPAQQMGAVLAQAPQRPISLVRRTLVIVREFRRPAFAVIILAPADFVLVADEPDRVGAVAERNADMTLSLEPEALGFAVMLACRGGIDRPSVAPACDALTHEQRRHRPS
jgi:hypothetical protein